MQPQHSRHASPRQFSHENEAVAQGRLKRDEQGDHEYYQPPYQTSDRFGHGLLPSGYVEEQYYERPNDDPGQHKIPYDIPSNHHQPSYSYVTAPIQASQPHVPLQSSEFPMPMSRGTHDPTGQACPPGGRPRVSTTIWEDEGTLCFQVEAQQVTVARREGMMTQNSQPTLIISRQ